VRLCGQLMGGMKKMGKKTGWVEKNEKHNTLVELDYKILSIAPNVIVYSSLFFFKRSLHSLYYVSQFE
jgi:hypothetical protein